MAMVTLTSPCNTKHLHDASISSYLNNAEETFVVKLAESSPGLSSLITTPNEHLCLGRKKFEDGEIGIFGAEKYFNGGTDEEKPRLTNKDAIKHQDKKDDPVDTGPVKPKIQPGTPSAYSESSWNSQSALLHSVQRNPLPRKTNKVPGKSFLSSFGCNCPCGDKNSVDVDETTSNKSVSFRVVPGKTIPKEPIKTGLDSRLNPWIKEEMPCNELGLGLKREDRFSFPVLNSKAGNLEEEDDNKPRKSLEVFGSPILEKGKKTLSLERKLTMLSWDAKPRAEETDIPASSDRIFNDTGSDASSDLFEIESFTNNANSSLTRQASDGGMSSCVTPTTCYAPSEASIEWSVVTASAADFSAMSDSEEPRTVATTTNPNKMVLTAKTMPKEEIQKRRPSLLGCKSHKAVGVADAYIIREKAIPDPGGRRRSDSFAPMTRFQAETKLTCFDSRNGQHVFDNQSLSQSHAAHSSHLLYIQ